MSQALELEDAAQSPKAFMYILDSFPYIKMTKAYKALESADFEHDTTQYTPEEFRSKIYRIIGQKALKGKKQKIDAAIDLEAKRQDPIAFLYILDNFFKPSSSTYKRIAKLVETNSSVRKAASSSTNVTSAQPTLRPILTDDRWIYVCADMISDDKAKQRFIGDMVWFVGNHNEWYEDQKKGRQKGFYADCDKSNEEVIERLRKYLEKRLHPTSDNMMWVADIYRDIPIEKIISYLQSIYVSR